VQYLRRFRVPALFASRRTVDPGTHTCNAVVHADAWKTPHQDRFPKRPLALPLFRRERGKHEGRNVRQRALLVQRLKKYRQGETDNGCSPVVSGKACFGGGTARAGPCYRPRTFQTGVRCGRVGCRGKGAAFRVTGFSVGERARLPAPYAEKPAFAGLRIR
jgi:hypothetical protein